MPFLVAPLVAAAGITGAAATFTTAILSTVASVGVSLGLNALAKSMAPKPTAGEVLSGIETSVQIGGDVARQIVIGTCKVHGQLVYQNSWGGNNDRYDQVIVLSDWTSDSLAAVVINGELRGLQIVSQDSARTVYSVAGLAGLVEIVFYNGTQTAAFADLISTANPAGRWTANSVLRGLTYACVRWTYAKDHDLYASGIPQIAFILRGARLYDWRKDSSAGGTGAHRWDNPATWEFSENPAVALHNYKRGFYCGGELILGMGVPVSDIIQETYTASANACDEIVATNGAPEPRYRCATVLTADDDVPHANTLDVILSTCAGYLYDYAGSYVLQVGVAQVPVATITDADLLVGAPVTFAAKRSRADLVNRIHGQVLDAAGNYAVQSYTAQVSPGGVVNDGEELGRRLDLLSAPSRTQAERIARIRLRENRAQATAAITLGYAHRRPQAGEWITWQSARFGTRTWRIVERVTDPVTLAVTWQLAEIDPSVYSWTAADEGPQPATPVRLEPGGRINTVSGFAMQAGYVGNGAGTEFPALNFFWDPVTDGTVDAVRIEYRRVGTTIAAQITDMTPGDGSHGPVTNGIVNGVQYEARASITTTPPRLTTWTPWVQVATGNEFAILVQQRHLAEQVRKDLEDISRLGAGTIRAELKRISDRLEELAGDAVAEAVVAYEARELARAATSKNEAVISTEQVARADALGAQATQITTLSTTVDGHTSTLTEHSQSLNGQQGSYGVVVTIDNTVAAGFRLTGWRALDGTTYGQFAIQGDLVVDGTIYGSKLAATNIITATAQIGNLTVDHIKIKNGAISSSTGATSGSKSATVSMFVRAGARVQVAALYRGTSALGYAATNPGQVRALVNGSLIDQVQMAYVTDSQGNSAGRSTTLICYWINGGADGTFTFTADTTDTFPVTNGTTISLLEVSR